MNYNEKGVEATGDERIFARQADNEHGSMYFALYYGGRPVDPKKMPYRNLERLSLRSVPKPLFDGYVSFLIGGEQRKLREIQRIQNF
jgi:hypothetical protein